MLKRLFLDHPTEVGETYGQHMGVAFGFGGRMIAGGLACCVHAFVPGLHKRTGSETIRHLSQKMLQNREHDRTAMDPADHAHGFHDMGFGI